LSLAEKRKDLWIITKEEINVGLQLLGYSDAMIERYSSIEVGSEAFGCLLASVIGTLLVHSECKPPRTVHSLSAIIALSYTLSAYGMY
jgi:hypothetical protein